MDEMNLQQKQSISKAICYLDTFIRKKKYSSSNYNTTLKMITPIGEEIEILTVEDAEACKEYMNSILTFERLYVK